jgi:hypothetical protein
VKVKKRPTRRGPLSDDFIEIYDYFLRIGAKSICIRKMLPIRAQKAVSDWIL